MNLKSIIHFLNQKILLFHNSWKVSLFVLEGLNWVNKINDKTDKNLVYSIRSNKRSYYHHRYKLPLIMHRERDKYESYGMFSSFSRIILFCQRDFYSLCSGRTILMYKYTLISVQGSKFHRIWLGLQQQQWLKLIDLQWIQLLV